MQDDMKSKGGDAVECQLELGAHETDIVKGVGNDADRMKGTHHAAANSDDGDKEINEDESDITDEEALAAHRRLEATMPSVVASIELAERRNCRNAKSGAGVGQALSEKTHIMLDRERLSDVDEALASCLVSCTHLHLQWNRLSSLGFLSHVGGESRLRYALLSHNSITSLDGLQYCSQLVFIDVSHNLIEDIAPAHLPASLRFLNVEKNPCIADEDCILEIICSLPALEELDGTHISEAMRVDAHQQLGLEYMEYAGSEDDDDDDDDDGKKTERRLSAAGAALRELAVAEEIDVYKSAAELAMHTGDRATRTAASAGTTGDEDGGNVKQDVRIVEAAHGHDDDASTSTDDGRAKSARGGSSSIVDIAVADAELAVRGTARRIIHASKMRLEEMKQADAEATRKLVSSSSAAES